MSKPMIRQATTADAPGIARVHVDSWRTTYRGIAPDDYLASLSYEEREDMWSRALTNPDNPSFVYVAEDEQEGIVGFAMGGPTRPEDDVYKGELYAIYLLQAYQRQGMGRRLISAVAERLTEMGIHSMLLWCVVGNPSCMFYEALGGQEVRRQDFELGGVTLTEIGYGWTDIGALTERTKT